MRSHTFDDVDELTDAAYRVRVAQRLLRWQMRRLQQAIDHHAALDGNNTSIAQPKKSEKRRAVLMVGL